MARPSSTEAQTIIKRDPLSTKGGKVPTGGSISHIQPPTGGSKPTSNGAGGSNGTR